MEPTVRLARADEARILSRIHKASWQAAYRGLLAESDLAAVSDDHWTAWFREGFDEQKRTVWVSLADRLPAACVCVADGPAADGGNGERAAFDLEIVSLYCRPDCWGQGHGTALMRTVQEYAVRRGYACVKLWVMRGNVRARQFYAPFGFYETGETLQYTVGKTTVEAVRYIWPVNPVGRKPEAVAIPAGAVPSAAEPPAGADPLLTDGAVRQWANRFLQAVVGQRDEPLMAFFHPEAVICWPNTDERFTRAGYVTANCRYPGRWRGTLERAASIAGGLVLAARIESLDGSSSHHVVSFFELESGRIRRLDEYWGADGAPPDWRQKLGLAEPIQSERSSDHG